AICKEVQLANDVLEGLRPPWQDPGKQSAQTSRQADLLSGRCGDTQSLDRQGATPHGDSNGRQRMTRSCKKSKEQQDITLSEKRNLMLPKDATKMQNIPKRKGPVARQKVNQRARRDGNTKTSMRNKPEYESSRFSAENNNQSELSELEDLSEVPMSSPPIP